MKTTEEYVALLKQLLDGTIQELVVEQAEYFNFREAWLKLPNRNDVIGEAGLNGRIIYRKKKINESSHILNKLSKNGCLNAKKMVI